MKNFDLSKEAKDFKKGKYSHFKGKGKEKLYEALGVAIHSETGEELVVYKALYGQDLGQLFVRPLLMFLEEVDKPEFNYKGPRFIYIEEQDAA